MQPPPHSQIILNAAGPSSGSQASGVTDRWKRRQAWHPRLSFNTQHTPCILSKVCPDHPHQGGGEHSLLPGYLHSGPYHDGGHLFAWPPVSTFRHVLLGENASVFTGLSVSTLSADTGAHSSKCFTCSNSLNVHANPMRLSTIIMPMRQTRTLRHIEVK